MFKNIYKLGIMLLASVAVAACVQETPADPYFSIEGDHVSYSVNYEKVEKTNAKVFTVRSNKAWELVAAEEYDWLKAFPNKGEGDGQFCFIIDANNSTEGREAIFTLVVGGETQTTVFTVTQGPRGEYVKASEKSFTLGYEEAILKLKVEKNVAIELKPVSDDSNANASWVTLADEQPEAEDSLYIKVAESTLLPPRTAKVAISMVGDETVADTLTIFQAGTQELYGLPAVWRFLNRKGEQPYEDNWQVHNKVPADEGLGSFSFVIADESNLTSKFTQVIGATGDPYVTGAWPGDYWLYEVPALIPANTLLSINFSGRVSATGHKYWMLEYLDGEEWKPVGNVLTSEETGSPVEYTNAMQNANAPIGGSFKVKNTMTSLKVRYRCMANWQSDPAKGGALTARNGGTARMTGDDGAELRIEVLGTNVGDLADVTMSAKHVALEGAEGSQGTFTFTSSEAWVLTSNDSWYTFTPERGNANEETTVTVTATEANATGALKKGKLTLNAGMSVVDVEIVQGAAGSILSPFISVVGGNYFEVTPEAANYTVDVQTNVEFTAVSESDWITIVPAAETKALVEVKPLEIAVAASPGEARTGKVILKNEEEGLETVLYVVQKKAPLHVEWLFTKANMTDDGYQATFTGAFKTAGDNGLYVAANVKGNGKLTFVQIDKTELDVNNKVSQSVGSTGHPTANGVWPGDYWLFEANDGETYPAGTKVNIDYITRTSATGMKWWRVEYLDGGEWKPAFATQEGTTAAGEKVQYNVMMNADGNTNVHVNCTVTYSAPVSNVQFRMLCLANDQAQGKGALEAPNGGTCRIAGAAGTSPIIKVVTE